MACVETSNNSMFKDEMLFLFQFTAFLYLKRKKMNEILSFCQHAFKM